MSSNPGRYGEGPSRTGSASHIEYRAPTQAEYIAGQLLTPKPAKEVDFLAKQRERVTLRVFSWETEHHSYRGLNS